MFDFHQDGSAGRILLNAPQSRNKLSVGLLEALKACLDSFAGDNPAVLSIVSTSPDIFAAGADMNELLKLDPASAKDYASLGQSVMNALADFPCPVFALVSGPCFGGGFDLAMACDWIWASENAVFCHPGAYLGIITGFGGTVRLPQKLPPQTARHMLTTGARMPAARARQLGLVSELFVDQAAMLAAFDRHIATDRLAKWRSQ